MRHYEALFAISLVAEDEATILTRYFPTASIVTTGRDCKDADVVFCLPDCLRKPERVNIDAPVSLIPPPDDFASLFILAPPWRRGPWLGWLRQHGLPCPFKLSRWKAEHVLAVLERYDRLSNLPLVKLSGASAVRGIEAEVVIADEQALIDDVTKEIALRRATRRLVVVTESSQPHPSTPRQHGRPRSSRGS